MARDSSQRICSSAYASHLGGKGKAIEGAISAGARHLNVLCVTSNQYLHCMRPFAYCFNKYWSDEQEVGVLCYEIPYGLPSNFTVVSLGKQEWYEWSGALYRFLKFVGWKQFIMLLDDYFLTEPVKLDVVHDLWEEMEGRWNLGKIDLTDDRLQFPHVETPYQNIVQAIWKDKRGKSLYKETGSFRRKLFLMSLQAAIWRTEFLLEYLDWEWNAWDVEVEGTKKLAASDSTWQIWGTKMHPVKYGNMLKSGKPMLWRLNKGMNPELWSELQAKRLV